jgi:hypothetical protein
LLRQQQIPTYTKRNAPNVAEFSFLAKAALNALAADIVSADLLAWLVVSG